MSIRRGNTIVAGVGGGGSGSVDIDNITITKNAANKIQAAGTINQNDVTESIREWKGTLAEYNALAIKSNSVTYIITDDDSIVDVEAKPIIGQIVQVLCNSNYVPFGTLPCNGEEYTKAQFSSLWDSYLSGANPKLPVCTYDEYAESIATYGQCAKFAIDEDLLIFKVPYIKNGTMIQQARTDSELNKIHKAGLPNITGAFNIASGVAGRNDYGASGAFVKGTDTTSYAPSFINGSGIGTTSFNASKSNSIYGNSNTVQPNAVSVRFFVVVASGAFNQSQMDWAAWSTALFNKVSKGHEVIAFQAPTAENNYTWYRKYADGWCEQGGQFSNTARLTTINLPVTMASGNYYASVMLLHCDSGWSATVNAGVQNNTRTATSFVAQVWYNSSVTHGLNCWEVKGMYAQE